MTEARGEAHVGVPAQVRAADTDTICLKDDGQLARENDAAARARATPSVRPIALRPGELLPGTRYRLLRWLGDGGMGTVFEAIHEDLDRRVALKILRDAFSLKTSGLFRKEAKTLGRLGSRYVVDVYDLVELRDGRLMIAMELLRGQPLRDALDRAGVLPLGRLLSIARQICKGLEAAHREDVVHRDIKPENISLEVVEGRRDAVKLLDFGIAQVDQSVEDRESRAGTPGYLAPEVISGVGGDLRVDVYAMGCLLFELVAARRPFENDDLSKILLAHLSESPTAPSLHASCPASLDAVVLKCLSKDPTERYASAAELEAALCEVQIAEGVSTDWDDLPLPDVDPEVVERLRRKMPTPRAPKRQWVPWAVAGGLVIALAAGAIGYGVRSSSDAASEVQSEADMLAAGARAAAARAFFVYPPPEDPEVRTALGHVTALEAMDGAGAEYGFSLAVELRTEFADTLERLGDQYWDAEGGRPFALDYYAEALVFDPARQKSQRRAAMTPGELRLLRSKAETSSFTAEELELVEPLIALADVDPDERSRRIATIEERSPRAEERSRQLRRVVRSRGQQPRKDAPSVDTPVAVAVDAPVEEAVDAVAPTLDVGAEVAEVEVDPSGVDPALARERTKAGDVAHRRGESSKAERLYAAALSADGKHAAAHHGLGRVAFDRGNYALAARRLKKAVRLAPRKGAYRIALGDALYKSFDYDGAHAQYLRAKELGSSQAAGRLAKVAKKR